jgi:DNA-binding NarL/FixJ family response regulator
MPVRILLADDHQIVREGLRRLLEDEGFRIVAEAGDGHQAIALASTLKPDVVVMDISMPRLNGVDACREILQTNPRIAAAILTMHVDESRVVAALRAGVRGYVVKTQATIELIHAIHEVAAGGTYLSPSVCGVVVKSYLAGGEPAECPLTSRERAVLQLVAEGSTSKEIADVLNVTPKTAGTYRERIMEKLGIHETARLVRYAIRVGMIEP